MLYPDNTMTRLEIRTDAKVALVFDNYPPDIRPKMEYLRALILTTAEKIEGLGLLEETLKWGEPSYLTKMGSTLRIDWKANNPNQYAMYFQCTSKLVPTFKIMFNNTFRFSGNRAIIFHTSDPIPEEALKLCIATALTYHKVKHLPALGM
jgi:hypothetical protein